MDPTHEEAAVPVAEAAPVVETEVAPAVEPQVPATNRDLIFGNKEAAPVVETQVTPAATETQEGLATLETPEGFDIVNLGDQPQEQVKTESQKGPQVDGNAAMLEQNALLTRLVNQMQSEKDALVQKPLQPESTVKQKPEFKDYQDNNDLDDNEAMAKYAEDLAEWQTEKTITKVLADQKAKDGETERQRADMQLRTDFNSGIQDAEKRYGNKFSSTMLNAGLNLPVDCMREVMAATKHFKVDGLSHDMVYHLCKRTDVVEYLSNASPIQQGVMIGDMARKIIALKNTQTKKVSEAPKPLTLVQPGAVTTETAPSGGKSLKALVSKQGGQRH